MTDNTTEIRAFHLEGVEIRAKTDETEGRAIGYAAVFNSDSHDLGGFVERLAPGAFTRSLQAAASGEQNIYALWSHRDDQPLGSTGSSKLVLREDEHGLAFEMDTTRMTAMMLDALRDGDLRMSFGFRVLDQQWRETEDGTIERTLIEVDLFEVSFVINPAYPATEAALRSLANWRASNNENEPEAPNHNEGIRVELMKRAMSKRLRK